MMISDFTFQSLGLKGNYLVMINYTESNENLSEFAKFLDGHKNLKYEVTNASDSGAIESKIEPNANVISSIPNKTSIDFWPNTVNVNGHSSRGISTSRYKSKCLTYSISSHAYSSRGRNRVCA